MYGWIRPADPLKQVAEAMKVAKVAVETINAVVIRLRQVGVVVKDGNLDVEEASLAAAVDGLFPVDYGDHVRLYAQA